MKLSKRVALLLSNLLYEEKPLIQMRRIRSFSGKLHSKMEKNLFRILTRDNFAIAGKIQLIGLQELKRTLGSSWPEFEERIQYALQNIIMRRISTQDAFFSRNSEEHIIVFAQLSEDQAKLTCAKILQDLTQKFLGHAEMKNIVIQTAIGKIDGKLVFHPTSAEELITREHFSTPEQAPPASMIFDHVSQKYPIRFLPIWDSKHEVISTYGVSCTSINKTGATPDSYITITKDIDEKHLITLDYYLFEMCRETLETFHKNNCYAIFSIPVSYETVISNERLKSYISLCSTVPEYLRRYFSFALFNVPKGVPAAKLRTITSMLNKFSRAVVLICDDVPLVDIPLYKECGLKGFIIPLKTTEQNADIYWTSLEKTVRISHENGIDTTILSVKNPDDLLLARQAGFKYIAGPILGPEIEKPGQMLRLTWEDFQSGHKLDFSAGTDIF